MYKEEMKQTLESMFKRNAILISRNDALEKEIASLRKENTKLKENQNHKEEKEKN